MTRLPCRPPGARPPHRGPAGRPARPEQRQVSGQRGSRSPACTRPRSFAGWQCGVGVAYADAEGGVLDGDPQDDGGRFCAACACALGADGDGVGDELAGDSMPSRARDQDSNGGHRAARSSTTHTSCSLAVFAHTLTRGIGFGFSRVKTEGYSVHPVEVQSDNCRYGCGEGFERATVVGAHYLPVLEM